MVLRLPRSTLFPYTTLFRSAGRFTIVIVDLPKERAQQTGRFRCLKDSLRSEEHTSELQSLRHLVCRLLLEKKKTNNKISRNTDTALQSNKSNVTTLITHSN